MVDLNHCDFTGFEPIFIWNESLSTRQSWIGNRLTSTKNIRLSIRITFLQNNTNEIEKKIRLKMQSFIHQWMQKSISTTIQSNFRNKIQPNSMRNHF